MLPEVIDLLICPQCQTRELASGLDFDDTDRVLLCDRGHSFDVARQGYVSLLTGDGGKITGDSVEMIAARADFLSRGHFRPIADAVASAVSGAVSAGAGTDGAVLEVGVGTGYYLAEVLDSNPGLRGIGVDVSKAAARRSAKSHPRMGSVIADVWRGLPVRENVLSAVTCVFAPRNAVELHRVLAADGVLVVVTPTARHQHELRAALGLIGVEDDKARKLGESLSGRFESISRTSLEYPMMLSRNGIETLVGMGPSVRHGDPDARSAAVEALADVTEVTASVTVSTYLRVS